MREIDILRGMLDAAGIEYDSVKEEWPKNLGNYSLRWVVPWRDQVALLHDGEPFASCISHFGSYGGEQGLIEFYDFRNEPDGYLNAQQAFELMAKAAEKEGR